MDEGERAIEQYRREQAPRIPERMQNAVHEYFGALYDLLLTDPDESPALIQQLKEGINLGGKDYQRMVNILRDAFDLLGEERAVAEATKWWNIYEEELRGQLGDAVTGRLITQDEMDKRLDELHPNIDIDDLRKQLSEEQI